MPLVGIYCNNYHKQNWWLQSLFADLSLAIFVQVHTKVAELSLSLSHEESSTQELCIPMQLVVGDYRYVRTVQIYTSQAKVKKTLKSTSTRRHFIPDFFLNNVSFDCCPYNSLIFLPSFWWEFVLLRFLFNCLNQVEWSRGKPLSVF